MIINGMQVLKGDKFFVKKTEIHIGYDVWANGETVADIFYQFNNETLEELKEKADKRCQQLQKELDET